MKTILTILISLGLIHCWNTSNAQFTVSGEFRPRLEYRDGYSRLRDSSQTPFSDILGRARISFDYQNERFTTRFSLQQAFVFGDTPVSSDTITKNTVNIFEAWFRYNFSGSFAVKAGRIEISYDDQRIIGTTNWRPWGSTHDLVLMLWELPGSSYKGNFGFAINNNSPISAFLSSYTLRNYKYLGYLWQQVQLAENRITLSFMAMLEANQKPPVKTSWTKLTGYDTIPVYNVNDSVIGYTAIPVYNSGTTTQNFPELLYGRATVGANFWFKQKRLELFLSGYYQFGHIPDGRKLSAWFAGGSIAYRFHKAFRFTLAADHLSGNNYSDVENQKVRSNGFATPYGSMHSYYGYMDMFSAIALTGNHAGLTDLYGRALVNFSPKASLEATYHWFRLGYGYLPASPPVDGLPYQAVDPGLGSEIDLVMVYKPFPNLEVNGGYCFFLPTSTMEIFKGLKPGTSKFAQFAYLMVTYKPRFFTTEK